MTKLYCLRCRKNQEIENPEEITMKNGGKAAKAKCPDCGGKMFKFLGKKKEENTK